MSKIESFVAKIGVKIILKIIESETFLPGLLIENGRLIIDNEKAKYIGDILHEASHIALMNPNKDKIYQAN